MTLRSVSLEEARGILVGAVFAYGDLYLSNSNVKSNRLFMIAVSRDGKRVPILYINRRKEAFPSQFPLYPSPPMISTWSRVTPGQIDSAMIRTQVFVPRTDDDQSE